MGRPFRHYLNAEKVYACGQCRTHLASSAELVSRHFHSKTGRAYLFHTAWNVVGGQHEHRMMTTGKHVVCDLYCADCMSCIGWQYILAFEESQKYKEGMCILERAMVVDFDKTSPAACQARRMSSVSSGSSAGGASLGGAPTDGVLLHPQPTYYNLGGPNGPPVVMLGGLAMQGMPPTISMGGGVPVMTMGGGPMTMFAADDSGSEDEDY